MLFTFKAAAREARAARKATAKQYKALRAIYLEGPLEITIRSGSHEVKLTPPLDELNQIVGDLCEIVRKRWLALKKEELGYLADWQDGKDAPNANAVNPAADVS